MNNQFDRHKRQETHPLYDNTFHCLLATSFIRLMANQRRDIKDLISNGINKQKTQKYEQTTISKSYLGFSQ